MAKERNTKQKCHILSCLKENSKKHLTAEDIFEILKEKDFFASKATVYRCLNKLLKDGIVRKYNFERNSSACYQYISKETNCDLHCHLICLRCEKVLHFESSKINDLQNILNKEGSFLVDLSRSPLYGLCSSCRNKK